MKIQFFAYTLIFMLLGFHSTSVSQFSLPVDSLTVLAKEKFDEGEEDDALTMYEKVLEKDPENYDALWNAAILHAREGYRLDDEGDQEEKFLKAMQLAEKVVELHPNKGHSWYAYAVAKGRMTEIIGTRDRIRAAHEIKDSIEKASEMIPEEALVWHLWGVWHSDVANVSRGERMAARFISRGLPKASNEKAEEYLKRAVEMDENSILFRLDLARHYIETGEDEKAKNILDEVVQMKPHSKDDPQKLEEAQRLLEYLR